MCLRITLNLTLIAGGIVIGLSNSPACAQATQPVSVRATASVASASAANDAWQDVVAHFSRILVEPDNSTMLRALLADHASLRMFGSNQSEEPGRLSRAAAGAMVLGVHPYTSVPNSLAADIAADFGEGTTIPEDVKRRMVPEEALMNRANSSARQWISSVLDLSDGQPFAIIVLWREHSHADRTSSTLKDGGGDVIFVLAKIQQNESTPRIKQVIFGNPLVAE